MALGPRLELRQSQNLVMTTQLQQSIKLLQLSALELSEFVATEIEQNPLLGRDEGGSEDFPSESEILSDLPPRESNRTEDVVEYGEAHTSWDDSATNALDTSRDAFWGDAEGGDYSPTASAQDKGLRHDSDSSMGGGRDFMGNISESMSLQDHLREQLQMDISDPVQRIIGLHLIDLVDERGYLPEDLSPICDTLGCSLDEVEAVLQQVQRFEPSGVFARNLGECLAIQLREKDRLDPAMEKLLGHLDLLASGEMQRVARLCGAEEEDLPFMLAEIRELNPKPGYRFGSDVVQAVVPDVFLRKASDGWQVELNPDALPKVLVNRQYYTRISETARRKEDKKYLSEQLAHANWLTKALDQRAQTILKVSTEIVRQQDAFFRKGIRFFKPLTLRDISEAVDMHESTVSRVTTQKYLSTGTAVYELKYFFSSALGSSSGGDAHSSESVKYLIKEMIDAESPTDILSDDTIAERLQQKGIDIARRTVAKYREALDIPSSPARRREKKRLK